MLRFFKLFSVLAAIIVLFNSCSQLKGFGKKPRVLIFSKTAGFRHESIPIAKLALLKLCKDLGYDADTTENANFFYEEQLSKYSAVVFLSTTGDVLNSSQEACFERFVQAGGGFVGIHAASDTEYGWPWFGKLVGAYFDSHPEIQDAKLNVIDRESDITQHLKPEWLRKDEWYNFKPKSIDTTAKVLIKLDEKSYKGGKNGDNHPFCWLKEYDGGRSFYVAGGHTNESYKEVDFLKLISGGLKYAVGANSLNYSKAYSSIPPDENRFTKRVLSDNLDEPCELAIDSKANVFFVQRKGQVFRYDAESKTQTQIAQIPVWSKFEDGLLGITLDPNFESNHWLYLFYSPEGDIPKQHVSRFTYENDTLHSERILLEIPTQREECCHSGGSLTFDKEGLMWISVGDNTNPFKSDGYSPVDERDGRSSFDAQRSAANTNDLRGKILRIKPESDGSYTIPKGNLFPEGTNKGRPEIYVMGCRNPYRISVDPHISGRVYWGDVGPDGGKDSAQGPKGYDELNYADKPGFYGWPYFIGNNKPYSKFNFADSTIAKPNNVKDPKNSSPNNTGLANLPQPQPALYYYPYADSDEFPQFEKGGRCAMAGPVYQYNAGLNSSIKHPRFLDGKVIFYDWMRNWFYATKVDELGKVTESNRVFTALPLNRIIDMEYGPDGALYALEYGTVWFARNADARLIRIEYTEDNRIPVAKAQQSIEVGKLPLTVEFTSNGSVDYDPGDSLTYEWRIESPFKIDSRSKSAKFTFTKPGIYKPILVVTDKKGRSATAELIVRAGNEPPQVSISVSSGNQYFYFPGDAIQYQVNVQDYEDGSSLSNPDLLNRVTLTKGFLQGSEDITLIAQGHQENKSSHPGEALITTSDCKACHQKDKRSIGPSWLEVSSRYAKDNQAVTKLGKKIISGGGGVWGDHAMSAHPQLSIETTKEMVRYILSLRPESELMGTKIANKGSLNFTKAEDVTSGSVILTASYTDKGAQGAPSLTRQTMLRLRHPHLEAEKPDESKHFSKKKTTGGDPQYMEAKKNEAYLLFKNVDLTGIKSYETRFACEVDSAEILIKLDSLNGSVIGHVPIPNTGAYDKWSKPISVGLRPTLGVRNLYVVYHIPNLVKGKNLGNIDYLRFSKRPMKPML